jgi:hypothetical protein
MTNSHEVINLETMAQCLADARALLREGDMCADTYVSLLEEASRLIRSVLTFVQGIGLELTDEDETEAQRILSHHEVVQGHVRSTNFQGGDFGLYIDLQGPGGVSVMECGLDSSAPGVSWELLKFDFYDLNKAVEDWVRTSHDRGTA